MSIALTILIGLFAAFTFAGALAGLTPPFIRAALKQKPAAKTRRDLVWDALIWLAAIALHCYWYPQFLWAIVGLGVCMLGSIAAQWYFVPPASPPRA